MGEGFRIHRAAEQKTLNVVEIHGADTAKLLFPFHAFQTDPDTHIMAERYHEMDEGGVEPAVENVADKGPGRSFTTSAGEFFSMPREE